LSEEVAGLDSIDIMSVTPGFVSTSMAKSMFGEYASTCGERCSDSERDERGRWCFNCGPPVVTADECAESVLCQLGSGMRHTSGHWKHSVQNFVQSWTPSEVLSDVTHTCMRRFQQRRRMSQEMAGEEEMECVLAGRRDIAQLPSVIEIDEKREDDDEEAGLLY
jgi:hypothetical protein